MSNAPTRGHGVLEPFLAHRRARRADRLIPDAHRTGAILDIGCGAVPYFLLQTRFSHKVGLETRPPESGVGGASLLAFDLESEVHLPFRDASFTVVTMLAVLEHLRPQILLPLLNEVHRVLRPEGIMILTTPAPWTDPLLSIMARIHLVSPIEIDEHEQTYSKAQLLKLLEGSAFPINGVKAGRFELGANTWVLARRSAERQETKA